MVPLGTSEEKRTESEHLPPACQKGCDLVQNLSSDSIIL